MYHSDICHIQVNPVFSGEKLGGRGATEPSFGGYNPVKDDRSILIAVVTV